MISDTRTNDYQTAIRMPATIAARLRDAAARQGVTVAAVIRQAVREYLDRVK